MIKCFVFFLFFPIFVNGELLKSPIKGIKKIQNQLIIEDFDGAFLEIQNLLKEDKSFNIFSLALKIYISLGREEEWIQLWREGCERFSYDELYDKNLLEDFCWGILKKGSFHSSGLVRLFSLCSAVYSNDLKAEKYILQAMQDDDVLIQILSVRMAEHYATPNLKKQISCLLNKKNLSLLVKLEVLDIIGKLKISSEKATLFNLIRDRYASSIEKRAAIRSLVAMQNQQDFCFLFDKDTVDAQSILVICELVRAYNLLEYKDFLLQVIENSCSEVQQSILDCLISLGRDFLSVEELFIIGTKFLDQKYPIRTRCLAAKLLLLNNYLEGESFFELALSSYDTLIIREASGILISLGEKGVSLAKKFLLEINDEQAKVDLSILLLLRQERVEEAVNILSDFLKKNIENPMTKGTELLFTQKNGYQNYTENFDNFHVSMILFHLLTVSNSSCQNELLSLFFEYTWKQGFSYLLNVFWEDKPNEVLKLLSALKNNPSKTTRLEAILSQVCLLRDDESVNELEKMYYLCSWQEKVKIMEIFALIEHPRKVPFLLQCCCDEEMLSLKIIAAGCLLMALQ